MTSKTPIKSEETYSAKVGCWNCDDVYEIPVIKGKMASQYIMESKLKCKRCGCNTLKMFSEYRIDKKIMKDVILHHKIEHPPEDEDKEKHEHYK